MYSEFSAYRELEKYQIFSQNLENSQKLSRGFSRKMSLSIFYGLCKMILWAKIGTPYYAGVNTFLQTTDSFLLNGAVLSQKMNVIIRKRTSRYSSLW